MILTAILTVFINTISVLVNLLPTLPSMPTDITNVADQFFTTIVSVISVITMVLSPQLTVAMVLIIGYLFTFDYVYSVTMWILRKIPMININ